LLDKRQDKQDYSEYGIVATCVRSFSEGNDRMIIETSGSVIVEASDSMIIVKVTGWL